MLLFFTIVFYFCWCIEIKFIFTCFQNFIKLLLILKKSSSKREIYSSTDLPQEARKISHKQPNPARKGIRKRKTNKT